MKVLSKKFSVVKVEGANQVPLGGNISPTFFTGCEDGKNLACWQYRVFRGTSGSGKCNLDTGQIMAGVAEDGKLSQPRVILDKQKESQDTYNLYDILGVEDPVVFERNGGLFLCYSQVKKKIDHRYLDYLTSNIAIRALGESDLGHPETLLTPSDVMLALGITCDAVSNPEISEFGGRQMLIFDYTSLIVAGGLKRLSTRNIGYSEIGSSKINSLLVPSQVRSDQVSNGGKVFETPDGYEYLVFNAEKSGLGSVWIGLLQNDSDEDEVLPTHIDEVARLINPRKDFAQFKTAGGCKPSTFISTSVELFSFEDRERIGTLIIYGHDGNQLIIRAEIRLRF